MAKYDYRFNMVLRSEERAMLQALAERRGVTESDIVRMQIRDAYADEFGRKRPGKPEPKYNSRAALEAKAR